MEVLGKSLYDASSHRYAREAEILSFKGDDGHVVKVLRMTPAKLSKENEDKAIMHIHGGGFCVMSPESTYCVCAPVANLTGLRVYCVTYRLAPEHIYPAALNDCVTAYKGIIEQVRPENLGVLGESAGATLGLTMLLKSRSKKLPMPAALACISPAADLTLSSETIQTLDGLDPVLSAKRMPAFQDSYVGNASRQDPLVSPLFGEYTADFPPTIIQTGTRDLMLSDSARMHQKLKQSGVHAELSVSEGMWHGFHILPSNEFPEADAAFRELADFFDRELKLHRSINKK
jgi:acetyl esterase/lipase